MSNLISMSNPLLKLCSTTFLAMLSVLQPLKSLNKIHYPSTEICLHTVFSVYFLKGFLLKVLNCR